MPQPLRDDLTQRTIEKFINSGTMTHDDLKLINKFIAKRNAIKASLGPARKRQLIITLCTLAHGLDYRLRLIFSSNIYRMAFRIRYAGLRDHTALCPQIDQFR